MIQVDQLSNSLGKYKINEWNQLIDELCLFLAG